MKFNLDKGETNIEDIENQQNLETETQTV